MRSAAIIVGVLAVVLAATKPLLELEIRQLLARFARWLLAAAVARLPVELRHAHEPAWSDEIEGHIEDGLLLSAILRGVYLRWLTLGPRSSSDGKPNRISRAQRLRRAAAENEPSARMLMRLWSPTAASASLLTLEFPLLLLVASGLHASGVAVSGVAWALGTVMLVDAGALALATVSAMAEERGWRSRDVRCYAAVVGMLGCGLLATIWTPMLGDPIQSVLGMPADRGESAQDMLRGLALAPLLVALRRHARGRLTRAEQTTWILPATLARTTLAVVLAVCLTRVADLGTFGIGLALTVGVALEAGVLSARSRVAAPGGRTQPAATSLRDIARVHLPLTGTMLLELAPAVAVLFALGASGGSVEALAGWSTICGLVWLVSSMTLDIEAITAAHHRARAAATLQLTVVLGTCLTLLWLGLGVDRAGRLDLLELAGLSNAAAEQTITALLWLAPFSYLCVLSGWLRGALVAGDRSWCTVAGVAIGSATLVASLALALVAGMPALVAVGMSVTIGAFAEAALLLAFARATAPPARTPAPA